jgi:hypothetical protein
MRPCALAIALLVLSWPAVASAEWQIKPFVGLTFAGSTTFEDDELAAGKLHPILGVSATLIGDVVGVEADFGHASGFFQQSSGTRKVTRSNVTTLTGNVTVALPRSIAEYTLRPYFVGGGGLMHVRAENFVNISSVSDDAPSVDLGGGVTGFLTKRIGVSWDVRHFRVLGGNADVLGLTTGGQLSFWRANMALAIRY